MIDIKLIRSNPERVKEDCKKKGYNLDKEIDRILELDKQRKEVLRTLESIRAELNRVSKIIGILKRVKEIEKEEGEILKDWKRQLNEKTSR